MMGFGIRARLAVLLALLLALMAGAAGYALYQLRGVTLSVKSVYDDRVLPLFQLRTVSDTYVTGLPRVARELRDGQLKPNEAVTQLARARNDAREQWARYKATYQVPRETRLIAEAEPLIEEADNLLARYVGALVRGVDRPAPQELQAATRSLSKVLDSLVLVQAEEAREAATASEGAYGAAVWALVALMGLACAVGVGLAWGMAVGYTREQRQRELEAERLAYCYAALSRTNQMIMRVSDERPMFEEMCRICVDTGLAKMVVVLIAEGRHTYRIAGLAGPAQELLGPLQSTVQFPSSSEGPIATAVQHGRVDLANDYLQDGRLARYHDRARSHGIRALGAFPVRRGGAVVGCMALFVDRVGFFDDTRVSLVEEMASDLSFALDNLDRDAAHAAAEREVAAGYERVRQIFNLIPLSITLISRHTGRVVLANAACAERYGLTPEDMLGRSTQEMAIGFSPADRERFFGLLDTRGSVRGYEVAVRGAHGETVHMLTNAELIDYMGEPCALAVSLDITERKRLEGAEQAQRDAEASSRAKTEFLSRMSHELRTPLNAVLGFSQLLQSNAQEPLSARQREQVEAIRLAGWHLLALVNDVLDVSRIESGHLRVESYGVNLVGLLDEVMRLLQPQADRAGVQLHRHVGDGPAVVLGDPVRLRQVLVNLLTNAIKYNRTGGAVTVGLARAGASVTLSIADTGIGMSRHQLDNLFEPFNRLGREHSPIEGTGIGLVLTRQLLTLMQGTLAIDSEEGHGTTVTVTLQKADTAHTSAAAPTSLGHALHTDEPDGDEAPQGVVLYIEDNPINLLLVEQLLLRWPGIRLVQAETGARGVELARALQPDLVLLDMRLPDLSGPQVMDALRADARTRGLRVVALSASAMPEEVALARERGALDYWTKPIDFARFTADMKRLLVRQPTPV